MCTLCCVILICVKSKVYMYVYTVLCDMVYLKMNETILKIKCAVSQ